MKSNQTTQKTPQLFGNPILFKTRNRRFIYHLLWWFTKMFYNKNNWEYKFAQFKKIKMISFQLMQPKHQLWFVRVMYHENPSYSRKNLIIGNWGSFGLICLSPFHNFLYRLYDKLQFHQWQMKRNNIVYYLCNRCQFGKERDNYNKKYAACTCYDLGRNNISCKKFKERKQ
jgi:hypothetical protein